MELDISDYRKRYSEYTIEEFCKINESVPQNFKYLLVLDFKVTCGNEEFELIRAEDEVVLGIFYLFFFTKSRTQIDFRTQYITSLMADLCQDIFIHIALTQVKRVRNTDLLFSELTYQILNRTLYSVKCSIMAPAKCKTFV